jgi:hypothetical protein
MVMAALIDRLTHPQHSHSALLRCAVLAYWFENGFSRMLVRVPVHGMQALLNCREPEKPTTYNW